ncbi:unnamed protein product [Rotaria sordida]|uniref:Uncharacterized protein n=1 Tax=Rotaria sordida TaxID=392033 RepID=A0A815MGQ8_9BILA|nr:unnamed protein product [Rotaria sordida]CAF1462932.1 unnamed protein product [Rotaria sordida]CAF4020226.1 unnamed protein product [Rotaria sordida]
MYIITHLILILALLTIVVQCPGGGGRGGGRGSSRSKVTGQGTDDVGSFTFDGIFSSENFRLALTQQYEAGTGDPTQNLGHTSTIQLTWNSDNNQFEGAWYVRTHKYSGDGEFELKFEADSIPLLNTNNEC